jgi:hypothetical protein
MGVSDQRHAPCRALVPVKVLLVPIVQEAGWAPEPVWTQRLEEKSSASDGDRTSITSRLVAFSLTNSKSSAHKLSDKLSDLKLSLSHKMEALPFSLEYLSETEDHLPTHYNCLS